MQFAKPVVLVLLAALAVTFGIAWTGAIRRALRRTSDDHGWRPGTFHLAVGFVTEFFDTLGVGSFATTTAAYRLSGKVDDRLVPGTLNVGHALPTILQALVYITLIDVNMTTLVVMLGASVTGAWFGAGVVASWPRRTVRVAMGSALLAAAALMLARNLGALPKGGVALALPGALLFLGAICNLVLGALMTMGIGLYAPCMILVSLLGMSPVAAFPIMMGSCAFLMPVGSVRFVQRGAYDLRAAVGLTLAGMPAVLIAAFVVRLLPLDAVRWLVIAVATYAAVTLLGAARRDG